MALAFGVLMFFLRLAAVLPGEGSASSLEKLMTAADVAARYQVPVRTVYDWVYQDLLPARRCGKRLLRFGAADCDEFERRSTEATR